MNRIIAFFALLLLVVAAAAWYLLYRQDVAVVEQVEVLPQTQPKAEPIRHPVENIPLPSPVTVEPEPAVPPEPLPELAESDAELLERAGDLLGAAPAERYFVPDFVASRIVATLDGLTARRLPRPMSPLQPVPGAFKVLGAGEEAAMSPENAVRYQPYVDLFLGADRDALLAAYLRYYPLLQQAYGEQGYPDAYFNDRLVTVLDHLLETPVPEELVSLRQNEAVYEFADPELEALSAGQKALIRLGSDNQRRVMQRLEEYRRAITAAGDLEPGKG